MPTVGWYLQRFRVMSGREILYRVKQQLTMTDMRRSYLLQTHRRQIVDPARFRFCITDRHQLPELPFDVDCLEKDRSAILRGEHRVAGRVWQWLPSTDIWRTAPDSGRCWPKCFFGSIDYRAGNPIGDVRQTWEPARLQQLVNLAAVAKGGDSATKERAVSLLEAQLVSWVSENPHLEGVHYISAMECGLRLIAVCHALDMTRGSISRQAWASLVAIVQSHASLIERRPSLFSSAGNHTTAEGAALAYAGLLFPEMPRAERWVTTGLELLTIVAREQILPDGGGIEQAMTYHQFNIQLLDLAAKLLNYQNKVVPSCVTSAIDRGTDFVATMASSEGQVPPIGDSDDGHALTGYLKVNYLSEPHCQDCKTFVCSGYTTIPICEKPDSRLIFDHGPLGMPPSFGHGHADALQVLLFFGDQQLLVDTGTYTYTGNQDWRRYFRGTRAHNTVTVDGLDQAPQSNCFMWSRPFKSQVIASETQTADHGRLLAEHDGYREIGVRHLRGLAWQKGEYILIWDFLSGPGSHKLALHWHIAVEPQPMGENRYLLTTSHGPIKMKCEGGSTMLHEASDSEHLGWMSPAYGSLQAITTMEVVHSGKLPHSFVTVIELPNRTGDGDIGRGATRWFEQQVQ